MTNFPLACAHAHTLPWTMRVRGAARHVRLCRKCGRTVPAGPAPLAGEVLGRVQGLAARRLGVARRVVRAKTLAAEGAEETMV